MIRFTIPQFPEFHEKQKNVNIKSAVYFIIVYFNVGFIENKLIDSIHKTHIEYIDYNLEKMCIPTIDDLYIVQLRNHILIQGIIHHFSFI